MLQDPSHENPVTWPCFAVGLAASMMVAAILEGPVLDLAGSVCFLTFSSLACAFAGKELSVPGRPRIVRALARVAIRSMVGGFAILELFIASIAAVKITVGNPTLGASIALAFLPSIVLVAILVLRTGRARRDSLVHGLDEQALWLVVVAAAMIGALCMELAPAWVLWLFLAACGAQAIVMIQAAWRVTRAVALVVAMRAASSPLPDEVPAHVVPVDLGLGNDKWATVKPAADAYRDAERVEALAYGDPDLARAAVRSTLWLVGAAIASVFFAAVAVSH